MGRREGILIEEHTVADLFSKLEAIHQQTKKTNGRVTAIEKCSIGFWVRNNPLKFAIFLTMLILLSITEFREPMITKLISFFIM